MRQATNRETAVLLKDWEETGRIWDSPGPHGERLRFFDFPAHCLMGLAALARQGMVRNHLEPWGLTMPEWRLLSTVADCSPIRFTEVARLTAMDKAQVSRALRSAQGKGLLQSLVLPVAPGAEGERATSVGRVHLSITPSGRELFDKVMPSIQREQLRLVQLMSAEERRIIIRLARRLFAQLTEERGDRASSRGFRGEAGELAAAANS